MYLLQVLTLPSTRLITQGRGKNIETPAISAAYIYLKVLTLPSTG